MDVQRVRKTAVRRNVASPLEDYLNDAIDETPIHAYVDTNTAAIDAYLGTADHDISHGLKADNAIEAFLSTDGESAAPSVTALLDVSVTPIDDYLAGVTPAQPPTSTEEDIDVADGDAAETASPSPGEPSQASLSSRAERRAAQTARTTRRREARTAVLAEPGAGVGVLSGTRIVDAAPIPDTAVIADAIATEATPEAATDRIIELMEHRYPGESRDTILSRAFTAIWRNIKPISYMVVTAAMVSVSVSIVSAYLIGSGGWLGLLAALQAAGVTAIPAVLKIALRSAGISLASNATINTVFGLAERNKRVESLLRKQIKPAILVNALGRMGVDVRNTDMSVKAFTRTAITNGISLASGDLSSYLISTGLTSGVRVASFGVRATRAGMISVIGRIKRSEAAVLRRTVDAAVEADATTAEPATATQVETFDAVDVAREVSEGILATAPTDVRASLAAEAAAVAETTATGATASVAPELTAVAAAREVLAENRVAVAATTTAIALTAVALTGDVSGMLALASSQLASMGGTIGASLASSGLATQASSYLAEHTMARQALFGIISQQTGLQRVFDVLIDRLTPESMREMRKLEGQIRRSRNADQRVSYTTKFFALLVGDRIYEANELETMSLTKLKEIASAKRIKFPNNVVKRSLVDAIKQEQMSRVNALTSTVAGTITGALKTSLAAATLEYGYQSYPITPLTVPEIDALLAETRAPAPPADITSTDDPARITAEGLTDAPPTDASHGPKADIGPETVGDGTTPIDPTAEADRILREMDLANRQELNRLIEEGEMMDAARTQALADREALNRLIEEGEATAQDLANRRMLQDIIDEGERAVAEMQDRAELQRLMQEYEASQLAELEYQRQLDAQQAATQAARAQHRANVRRQQLEDKHTAAREAAERAARTLTRAAERLQARRLADAARLADAEAMRDVIISGPDGGGIQVPTANRLLDPEIQKALDVKITPLLFYLKNAAADSLLSYIPGVGMVNSVLTTAQWTLDVASTLRTATRIARAVAGPGTAEPAPTAQTLQEATGLAPPTPATPAPTVGAGEPSTLADAETYASARLDQALASGGPPTLTKVVSDMIHDDQVHLKVTVLRALRNKLVYGWDDARVAYEIGKEVIAGKALGDTIEQQTLQAATLTDGMIRNIGGAVWTQIDRIGGLRQGVL